MLGWNTFCPQQCYSVYFADSAPTFIEVIDVCVCVVINFVPFQGENQLHTPPPWQFMVFINPLLFEFSCLLFSCVVSFTFVFLNSWSFRCLKACQIVVIALLGFRAGELVISHRTFSFIMSMPHVPVAACSFSWQQSITSCVSLSVLARILAA